MKWDDLWKFILIKDRTFSITLEGVPLSDIRSVEQQRKVKLPQIYIDFLQAMGQDTGAFPILGCKTHDFFKVIKPVYSHPEDKSFQSRYFRIGEENDPAELTPMNLYIDLYSKDVEDPVLVESEASVPVLPENIFETDRTLSFQLAWGTFQHFELKKRKEQITLYSNFDPWDLREAETRMKVAIQALNALKFERALPLLTHLACMSRDDMSATIEIHPETQLVGIYLGSDNPAEKDLVVKKLLQSVPNTKLYKSQINE